MVDFRRNGLFWGIVLIAVGGLFLLNALGVLAFDLWRLAFPAILVLVGLWMLVGRAVGLDPHFSASDPVLVPLEGAGRGSVRLHLAAGEMHVRGTAPAGQLLESNFGGGAAAGVRRDGGVLDVDLHGEPFMWLRFLNPLNWGRRGLDWNLALNESLPLDLSLEVWAGEAHLDLSPLHLTGLELRTTMGESEVTLPAETGSMHARIHALLGEVRVYVPEGTAARIYTSSVLGEVSVNERRFPRSGAAYQSPGYDASESKIEIDAEAVLGELTIR